MRKSTIPFKRLNNTRGNTLLIALVTAAIVAMAAVGAQQTYLATVRQARHTKVRGMMASMQSIISRMAYQPYAYNCAPSGEAITDASTLSAISRCTINTTYFDNIKSITMPGAECDSVATCGFTIVPTYTSAGNIGKFTAVISYEGKEVAIQPANIALDVPAEILQSARFNCGAVDPTKPVFSGFDATGAPICRGFTTCPVGSYATSVNFNTLVINCAPIPSTLTSCPANQYISSYSWSAASGVTSNCATLPIAPFTP